MPGLMRELRRRAVEVRDYALRHQPVDRRVQAVLDGQHLLGTELELSRAAGDERPENAPQEQELRDDLAWGEAERLALAGVRAGLRGELAAAAHPLGARVDELAAELADEGRHVAELAQAAKPLQRWNLVVHEPLLDGVEGEIPGGRLDLGGELLQCRWGRAGSHYVH